MNELEFEFDLDILFHQYRYYNYDYEKNIKSSRINNGHNGAASAPAARSYAGESSLGKHVLNPEQYQAG